MLKRTLTALLLIVLATAAAATAQTPPPWTDHFIYTGNVGGIQVVQAAALLRPPKPAGPPPASPPAQYNQYSNAVVQAVNQWMIAHGFLEVGNFGMTVYHNADGSIEVDFSVPGMSTIRVIVCGPTFPLPGTNYWEGSMIAVIPRGTF